MKYLYKIMVDFLGICKKLNPGIGLRWLFMIIIHFPGIMKKRDLLPADRAMGSGPFLVKYSKGVQFYVGGPGIFSGIREMYVRDTYLHNGALTIKEGDTVLDLGSNIGNFVNLALAHGASKAIGVEPSRELNQYWQASVGLNDGFSSRTTLLNAFVGQMGKVQNAVIATDPYKDAGWISEDELLDKAALQKIDFLKCDIEGGEFGLLNPDSKILRMARNIAIEIHNFAGNAQEFLSMLIEQGFDIKHVQRDPDGSMTVLGSRG